MADGTPRRPDRPTAERAIQEFLDAEGVGGIAFSMIEDGDEDSAEGKCGWAFWLHEGTTNYVHEDLSIEWYG